MEYIRSFLAIEMNQAIIENIVNIQTDLKKDITLIKWVRPQNMHLTLIFFGNIGLKDVDRINDTILDSVSSMRPFYIKLKSIGVFPNPSRPRVLWIGVDDGYKDLESLYNNIIGPLKGIGFKPENRDFHPHLTLGRFKSNRMENIINNYLEKYKDFEFGEKFVDRIALFKSELRSSGAVYTKLRDILFKEGS